MSFSTDKAHRVTLSVHAGSKLRAMLAASLISSKLSNRCLGDSKSESVHSFRTWSSQQEPSKLHPSQANNLNTHDRNTSASPCALTKPQWPRTRTIHIDGSLISWLRSFACSANAVSRYC